MLLLLLYRPGKTLTTVAVLGRQKLTVLRDTIKCEADATLTKNNLSRPSASLYFEVCFWPELPCSCALHIALSAHLPQSLMFSLLLKLPAAVSPQPLSPPHCSLLQQLNATKGEQVVTVVMLLHLQQGERGAVIPTIEDRV